MKASKNLGIKQMLVLLNQGIPTKREEYSSSPLSSLWDARRSTVLSLPLPLAFPDLTHEITVVL